MEVGLSDCGSANAGEFRGGRPMHQQCNQPTKSLHEKIKTSPRFWNLIHCQIILFPTALPRTTLTSQNLTRFGELPMTPCALRPKSVELSPPPTHIPGIRGIFLSLDFRKYQPQPFFIQWPNTGMGTIFAPLASRLTKAAPSPVSMTHSRLTSST